MTIPSGKIPGKRAPNAEIQQDGLNVKIMYCPQCGKHHTEHDDLDCERRFVVDEENLLGVWT